jgi:hypothetical protein
MGRISIPYSLCPHSSPPTHNLLDEKARGLNEFWEGGKERGREEYQIETLP